MEWTSFAGEFIAGFGGVALAGGLLRIWFDRRLTHALDRELEKLRTELLKDVDDNRIRKELQKSERNRVHQKIIEFLDAASIAMDRFGNRAVRQIEFDISDAHALLSGLRATQSVIRREELNLDPSVPIVFKNLFEDTILALEVTFTEGYEGAAELQLRDMYEVFEKKRSRMLRTLRDTL